MPPLPGSPVGFSAEIDRVRAPFSNGRLAAEGNISKLSIGSTSIGAGWFTGSVATALARSGRRPHGEIVCLPKTIATSYPRNPP